LVDLVIYAKVSTVDIFAVTVEKSFRGGKGTVQGTAYSIVQHESTVLYKARTGTAPVIVSTVQ
jgi:hypothetical protein